MDCLGGKGVILSQQLVLEAHTDGINPSLTDSPEEGPSFSGAEHNLAPTPRPLEPPCLVPGWDEEEFRGLSPAVVNTITQVRAPSTRWLYDLKWHIFVNWCSSQGRTCRDGRGGIGSVLSFLIASLWRRATQLCTFLSRGWGICKPSLSMKCA